MSLLGLMGSPDYKQTRTPLGLGKKLFKSLNLLNLLLADQHLMTLVGTLPC